MDTVSHRELRNQSGAVLDRVRRGETIAVTNHGEVTAILVPPSSDPLDLLRTAGRIHGPSNDGEIGPARRVRLDVSTAEILDGLRGDR